MVAIFTGSGTGLERGSAGYLGNAGLLGSSSLGRGGERLFVNAATGNLIVQQTDEFIVGRGPDAAIMRTYNSLGDLSDENGDNWRMSTDRRIYLTGTVNTAGSSVRRVSGDGTDAIYAWDAARGLYSAKDVDRADDTLAFAAGVWTWTDGATQMLEKYVAAGAYWKFSQQIDTDGNTLTFTNPAPNVLRVTTADGGFVNYHWNGNNLTKLVTGTAGVPIETTTWYEYDSLQRLVKVKADLTATDHLITDGNIYSTTYEYASNTRYLASISQSDGSKVTFNYYADFRICWVEQTVATGVTRKTEFSYGTEANGSKYTTITDHAGQITRLDHDSAGRLVKVTAPAAVTGGSQQINEFAYTANGDVGSIKDALGNVTTYVTSYQAVTGGQHRIVTETDPLANVVTRTYGLKNELLREVRSGSNATAADAQHISRFVYDGENHLRFAIGADGSVTEYVYTGPGMIENVIGYPDLQHAYVPSDPDATITFENMVNWRDGLADRSGTMITFNQYDARGNLTESRQYAAVATNGVSEPTDEISSTFYSYSQSGQLLSRNKAGQVAETFVYDGLGRLIGSTDLNGGSTTILFDDAATKTTVTLASGHVQTSIYNLAGELLTTSDSGPGVTSGTAVNAYDQAGRLRVAVDATGFKTYFVYDKIGRLVGEVRAAGQLTEFRYDAANRLVAKLSYFNTLSSATLEQLGNQTSSFEMSQLRPAFHASDVCLWQVYDAEGRLTGTVSGAGGVTAFHYDKSDRLVKTISYANQLSAALVGQYKTAPPAAITLPAADALRDGVARNFYDGEGNLLGTLDGEGYVRSYSYDRAGRKVSDYSYATAANPALRDSGTFSQLIAGLGDVTKDRRMRYVYDGRGYLRYEIDRGAHLATEYVYDAAGQVTQTIRYAGNIGQPSKYTVANVKSLINASGLANSPQTRRSFAVYDTRGRVEYSIDAEGAVERYSYDNRGQVVLTVRYAVARPTTSAPALSTMSAWKDGQEANAGNRVTYNYWSARGELRFAVDGAGYVTEYEYDAAGRVTHERRWDSPLPPSNAWTVLTLEAQLSGTFAETRYGYDWGGAVTDIYNGENNHVEQNYHGNLVLGEKRVVAGGDDSSDVYENDGAGRVLKQTAASGTSQAAVTRFTYDGRGNVVATEDARANTASRTVDRNGRVLSETDAEGGVSSYEYNAFGELVKATDPRGNSTYNYYDVMGRLVATRDAEGFLTETTYTVFGQPATVTRRYVRLTGTPSTTVAPVATPDAKDATTQFEYDRLGRLVKTIDAESHWEQYTLDVFGDRVAVRNKLGGTVYNQYDKRGLLIAETLPMASYNLWGQVYSTSVTNRFEYDPRGNLAKKIEAWQLPEQRTTSYFYDKADRLVETRGDPVSIVNASDYQNGGTVTPTEYRRYDQRGRLSETVDALGARTLFYYDKMDRVVAEIGATGTYTAYSYDANGNVLAARVYGTPSALPATHGGPAPQPVGSSWRETTYSYDNLNRLKTTTTAGVRSGAWSSQGWETSGYTVTTSVDYDANGNVIKSTDANGNAAFSFYDRLGRKTADVDQEKYLTTYAYDAEGNVLQEIRYPAKIAITVTPQSDVSTLAAYASGVGERITVFTYDRNGRRTAEERQFVYNSALTAEGQLGTSTTHSTIAYEYNGLGQVTRKIHATGDQILYSYDSAGRLTEEYRSAFLDHTGAAVTPTTLYRYNGVNDLAMSKQGGGLAPAAGDRYTRYTYGAGGRLASMEDATGATYHYAYDAAGNVLLESWSRLKSDGSSVSDAVAYVRDVLGRVTSQAVATWSGTAWVKGDGKDSEYNAFGEISRSGTNGIWQEHFDYDGAGRLWRSNAGDGSWRQYGYDANGKQTLALEAGSSGLGGISYDDALWFASQGYVTVTATQYDKRGLAVATIMPGRQLGGGAAAQTLQTGRSYNAFGEVETETDARNNMTTFHYNRMGRLVAKVGPEVSAWSETGASATVSPTERFFYDASGRLIATRDANAELIADPQLRPTTTRKLLAGTGYDGTEAMVTAVYNPDGGVGRIFYDVFGDARILRNELNQDETRSYDAKGRLTQQTHRGGLLTDHYGYDILGQRITHWNSQLGSTNVERTDYDSAGRVVSHVAFGGDVTTTSYAWDPTIATPIHYSVYGGWTETTTHANGLTLIVKSDAFEREVWKKDLGGREFTTGYDVSGRMVTRSTAGETLTYGWYNTGLAASVTSSAGAQSLYGYDEGGNRTSEYTTRGGAVVQNAVASYDALGRMTQYQELGSATSPAAKIDYLYDANGNIRRSLTEYRPLDSSGSTSSVAYQDNWYRYDVMNRVTLARGKLQNGAIVRGDRGESLSYDAAGRRKTSAVDILENRNEWWWHSQNGVPQYSVESNAEGGGFGWYKAWTSVPYSTVRTEYFDYRGDGQLSQVRIADTGQTATVRATFEHDSMGRLTRQTDIRTGGGNAYDRQVFYNAKGQVYREEIASRQGTDTFTTIVENEFGTGSAYALGAVPSRPPTSTRTAATAALRTHRRPTAMSGTTARSSPRSATSPTSTFRRPIRRASPTTPSALSPR